MSYCYTINSHGLDIVFFSSTHAAYNYAVKHNIRMANGKIKIHKHRCDICANVREEFKRIKQERMNQANH